MEHLDVGHVLVLGGTTEARALAQELVDLPGVRLTTSLPVSRDVPVDPPGEVHRGGFGGPTGLAAWLAAHDVRVVVDATSPFAGRITAAAVQACAAADVPLVVLERPAWVPQPGDDWRPVADLAAAAAVLATGPWDRALVAAGARDLGPLARLERPRMVLRVPRLPEPPLPPGCEVVLRRRAADVDGERSVLRERRVDVVVTTDSGGPGGAAVLVAARELGLPVVVVQRPAPPSRPGGGPTPRAASAAEASAWVQEALSAAAASPGPPGSSPRGPRA
ncbi:precorrin-6A/cobalt-precorrin-6A reductase [Pseudokineococcus basanitobsidens]|uniref:Precorrin-6A/cobalt-precorrin-6A reductase n=1 Tax=Pseudokineococcus basanitobsidens TaxID=1926649 RepID=A0ABU8RLS6_9ACTN